MSQDSSFIAGILPDSPDSGSELSSHSPMALYSDPGLYYPDYLEPGLYTRPGISQGDCKQPLPAPVAEVNNPGTSVYTEVKQEPQGSVTKPVVNKRKRRGVSEDKERIKWEMIETDQVLHFTAFQPTKWRETYTPDFQILKTPMLKVSADKGFNFSLVDEAFIAQKKNHFQLSCQVNIEGEHSLITTDLGLQKIEYFQLNFYGVKTEAPDQRIMVK